MITLRNCDCFINPEFKNRVLTGSTFFFTYAHGFDNISDTDMATTPVNFLREVQDELKKVVWPTKEEVIRLTGVVVLVSLFVGLFLGGADFILTKLIELVVIR